MDPGNDHVRMVVQGGWRKGIARHGRLRVSYPWYALYVLRAAGRYQTSEAKRERALTTVEALGCLHLEDLYLAAACDSASAAAWLRLEECLLPRVERSPRVVGAGHEQAHDIAYGLPGALYSSPAAQGGAAPFAEYSGKVPILSWLCATAQHRLASTRWTRWSVRAAATS